MGVGTDGRVIRLVVDLDASWTGLSSLAYRLVGSKLDYKRSVIKTVNLIKYCISRSIGRFESSIVRYYLFKRKEIGD